ncbi:hypothetical protein BKA62DRAFT_324844 [Auriculariales sp. MPI-PUGE-AT-0066]|nr:hypothetical protein BKA62DRAFT_324844 [Auriculariales sp. MPI-PUGE-AT-0066]
MVQAVLPDAHAIIVEDDHGLVSYTHPTDWTSKLDPLWYSSGTYHVSRSAGASVVFEFEGSAVWLYGDRNIDHGAFEASIDGSAPEIGSSYGRPRAALQLLYSANVEPGRHRLNITNIQESKPLSIDYFAYLPLKPSNNTSQSSPSKETTSLTAQSSAVGGLAPGAIVGLVMGVFAFILLAVLLFLFWSERRRKRHKHAISRGNNYSMKYGFDALGESKGSEASWMRGSPVQIPAQMHPTQPGPPLGYAFSRRPESYISVEPTMTDVPVSEVGDWHRRIPSTPGMQEDNMVFHAGISASDRYFGSESMSPPASTVPETKSIITRGGNGSITTRECRRR